MSILDACLHIEIAKFDGTKLNLPICFGKPLFILGRNGAGKSALLHWAVRERRFNGATDVVYLPGSRPSHLDADSVDLTLNGRNQLAQNLISMDLSLEMRIRPIAGTLKNQKALFDFVAAEINYQMGLLNDLRNAPEGGAEYFAALAALRQESSPLDKLNRILEQAAFSVRLVYENSELRAMSDQGSYSIARMSDGERLALVLACDVLAAPERTIFFIDEPELHMHPAVATPLIAAILRERRDCAFVIATHELGLPMAVASASIICVRACRWAENAPMAFDADLISDAMNIPEDVRLDILGARRKILFVEGQASSLDQPLFAILYPSISVRPHTSCAEVRRAVEGLRRIESEHHVTAFGIVDGDGMDDETKSQLENNYIFPLPFHSIESLYFCADVVDAVADVQATTFGKSKQALIDEAVTRSFSVLKERDIDHLSSRLAERSIRDKVMVMLPRAADLIRNQSDISLNIASPYRRYRDRLSCIMGRKDFDALVSLHPIRHSQVPQAIARALLCPTESDYIGAAIKRISSNEALKNKLRAKLAALNRHLGPE